MTPANLPVQTLPTAAAAQTESPAAGPSAPADFLLMLGQLVGAAGPKTAGVVTQLASSAQAPEGADDAPADDAAGLADFLAMFSLPLPVAPLDLRAASNAAAQTQQMLAAAGDVLQGRSPPVAVQVQLLAGLLQADTSTSDDSSSAPDPVQLPMTVADAQQLARTAPGIESMLSRPVHQPVGSAAWADEIGSRLTLMVEAGKHTASLRLSPEHLGPLEIRVSIRDDQASVWFGAAHADTRAAIEHALPRLRELFASQGMALADAGVFREPPRERPGPLGRSSGSGTVSTDNNDAVVSIATRIRLGLVDAYA